MPRFVQLHILTSYPPANLNRDDLGRPKTAWMGGAERLRVSSQSLKRAWRTSEVFKNELDADRPLPLSKAFLDALDEAAVEIRKVKPHEIDLHPHIGVRTKDIGYAAKYAILKHAEEANTAEDVTEAKALKWAKEIADGFGERDKESADELRTGQIVHFSMRELYAIDQLTKKLAEKKRGPEDDELKVLRREHQAVDIALFGRMLAGKKAKQSIWGEASVQVAHAITVHGVEVEDDYFTAVDDLNVAPGVQSGSGFLDTLEFGAGLFYLYICVDREQLEQNLMIEQQAIDDAEADAEGDSEPAWEDPKALASRTVQALADAAIRVTPSGKRNAFGHHTYAHHVLAERGDQQPRSLAVAFLSPVDGAGDWLAEAGERLASTCSKMEKVYGACAEPHRYRLDFTTETGTLDGLKEFVAGEGEGNWAPPNGQEPGGEA